MGTRRVELYEFQGFLLAEKSAAPAERWAYRCVKRAMDVAVSSFLLVAGAPLAGLIAAAIKLTSPGPVIFGQKRLGENGREFTMYKFRSLAVHESRLTDREWTPADISPLGRILRRFRLDEWPQFWNVLRGEMSIVGPRPERVHFAEGFRQALPDYTLRHQLKPGITGWAQVHGMNGHTEISRRLEYDLYYLKNWSLSLDLRIMLLTALRPVLLLLRSF